MSMPTEPRIPVEPTLEELSSYLDHELDAATQARVAEHVAGCADCTRRLSGLRETIHAVRALPMETPKRTFTIPAQRRQSFRWAPAGWVGSAAVALLIIGLGIQNLHLPASTSPTSGSSNGASSARKSAEGSGVAPLAAPAASGPGQQFDSQAGTASANASTLVDPRNGSRRIILGTESASYAKNAQVHVTIQLEGSPSTSTNSSDQGLTLMLLRNGAGVALHPVGVISRNGTPIFGGTYDLAGLPLAEPRSGDYQLEATWVIPDGSGSVLQVDVPLRITG
jgi:anti-sigma factor RsiW